MSPTHTRTASLLLSLAAGCGARSELDVGMSADRSPDTIDDGGCSTSPGVREPEPDQSGDAPGIDPTTIAPTEQRPPPATPSSTDRNPNTSPATTPQTPTPAPSPTVAPLDDCGCGAGESCVGGACLAQGSFIAASHISSPSTLIVEGIDALANGGAVITGLFSAEATFGAGQPNQTTLLTESISHSNTFVAAYDAADQLLWARQLRGDVYSAEVIGVSDGGVLSLGRFSGTATFPSSASDTPELTAVGGSDAFLAKYDAEGALLWVEAIVGDENDDLSAGVEVESGEFVVVARGGGPTIFDVDGDNTLELEGGYHLATYGPDGDFRDARRLGELALQPNLSAMGDGGVFFSSALLRPSTFAPDDPNAVSFAPGGSRDVLVAAFNPDGALSWARSAGGPGDDYGVAAAWTAQGGLVAGWHGPSALFGEGERQVQLDSESMYADFLASYSNDGQLQWVTQVVDSRALSTLDMAVLRDGSPVLVGQFSGEVTLGTGASSATLTALGFQDVFVARFSPRGELIWVRTIGNDGQETHDDDVVRGVCVLSDGSIAVVGGLSQGHVTFGANEASETTLHAESSWDGFVARFAP